MSKAATPVSTKASGNLIEAFAGNTGAVVLPAEAETVSRRLPGAETELLPADMGNEASIVFFFGDPSETTRFKLSVEMHRAAISSCAKRRVSGKVRKRFQYFHHRLWRFQAARV